MKYRCCQNAISSFMITQDTLAFCPMENKVAFIENYDGNTDFIDKYLNARKKHIENCKNENLPEKCLNCSQSQIKEWDESLGIDFLGIANRTKCSCNCIYCTESEGDTQRRQELNILSPWNIKPVLLKLAENKLFKNSGRVFIAGGECAEYPPEELKWLIDYSFNHNFNIELASSGIFYSKEIENALRTGNAKIKISIDSGTKETYEKIKRVKTFDKVWKNLKNYIIAAKDNPNSSVSAKYIILQGINDNLDEIKTFIQKCNEINCTDIEIATEFFELNKDRGKMYSLYEKTRNIIFYLKNLNDSRIHFDMFDIAFQKKTSARTFSSETAQALQDGHLELTIVVFSGTSQTYQRLTNQDAFNKIWQNINSYAESLKNNSNLKSSIIINYKLIPQKNDSIDEIKSFLNMCSQIGLTHIKFDLSDSSITPKIDISKISSIKKAVQYLKGRNNESIILSQELLSLT